MQAELEALKKKKPPRTPPPRIPKPSPSEPTTSRSSKHDELPDESGDEEVEGLTEGAKNNRLRRICERKPSGKCAVSDAIHEQWKAGGHKRQALMDILAESNWDKDPFDNQMQIPPYLLKYRLTITYIGAIPWKRTTSCSV